MANPHLNEGREKQPLIWLGPLMTVPDGIV